MTTCKECVFSRLRDIANPDSPGWNPNFQAHWPKFECRRNAPVVAVDSDGDEVNPWPLVQDTDRCGQGRKPGELSPLELHAQAMAVVLRAWAGIQRATADENVDHQIRVNCDDLLNIIEEGRA